MGQVPKPLLLAVFGERGTIPAALISHATGMLPAAAHSSNTDCLFEVLNTRADD